MWGNDSRVRFINRIVKIYDRQLYADRNKYGTIFVLRKGKRFIKSCDLENGELYGLIDSPQFVFALTDNWKANGVPRDWGSEHILGKLRDMDYYEDPEMIEKLDRHNEKVDRIKAKDFRNNTEAFLSDRRSVFQKAFDGINTSTLPKRERRKEIEEKRRK